VFLFEAIVARSHSLAINICLQYIQILVASLTYRDHIGIPH